MSEILIVHGGANKIRAKAAAIVVAENLQRFDTIIFSGGKTSGSDKPSEAESMKRIFLSRIKLLLPDIDTATLTEKIQLEEESCDTEDNALRVKDSELVHISDSLTLLSSLSHLPRIASIYKRGGGLNISTLSAEKIFWDTGKKGYQNYLKKFFTSFHFLKPGALEIPLFFLTQFPQGRKWIRSKTAARIQK